MSKEPYVTHDEKMANTKASRKTLENTHKTKVSAVQKAAQDEINSMNKLCFDLLGVDDGAKLLKYLEHRFLGNSMIRRDPSGRVDEYATIAANGVYEVFNGIKQMIKFGGETK